MRHLLVTNDFPPKIGGIQSYLWELWRRLPPEDITVLTTPYAGDAEFDQQQPYRVIRTRQRWLLPTPPLIRQVKQVTREVGAELVVLDPVLPLGLIGPQLDVPYCAIAHGAEYVIPERIPFTRPFISRVTRNARGFIASGDYVAAAARRVLGESSEVPIISIPPGVDVQRFSPATDGQRAKARQRFELDSDAQLVLGVSRLVPRKGFDRLIRAAAQLKNDHPRLRVMIAGKGREASRLQRLIDKHDAPVTLLGRVPDDDLSELYRAADVFCMPCHDRWLGLEQEGFGIVFVEAAAAGVPSVAGLSGGSGEAVADGETGIVVTRGVKSPDVASALRRLLDNEETRRRFAQRGVERANELFSYDHLADELKAFLQRLAVGK